MAGYIMITDVMSYSELRDATEMRWDGMRIGLDLLIIVNMIIIMTNVSLI